MTDDKTKGFPTKTVIAGAIGSAAIAAAALYMSKRRKRNEPEQLPPIPSGEPPETD